MEVAEERSMTAVVHHCKISYRPKITNVISIRTTNKTNNIKT